MKTRIVIPTFNERENIIPLIESILTAMPQDARILVVDDSSPDGTGNLVSDFAARDGRVSLITRSSKLGLGSAYQAAFKKVLADGQDDIVVTMDADFSHPPHSVPELVRKCTEYDLVVGSRYVPGGRIENWELWRRALSWWGNLYVRTITGLPIRDCTAGFSAMRTDFLRHIPFGDISANGYAWWFSLRMLFYRNNARIIEVPIEFNDRKVGASKISGNIIYEGLIEPWRVRRSVD